MADSRSTRFPIEFESEQEELAVLRRLWASALDLGSIVQVPCEEDHDQDTGCCDGAGWTYLHTAPRILEALRGLLESMQAVDERVVNSAGAEAIADAEATYARALSFADRTLSEFQALVVSLGPSGQNEEGATDGR